MRQTSTGSFFHLLSFVSVLSSKIYFDKIVKYVMYLFPSSKTASFYQYADGPEPAKIFSNQKGLSRTEQRHVSRITIKVITTSRPGV